MDTYKIVQLIMKPTPSWIPVLEYGTKKEAIISLRELREENPGTIFEIERWSN